MTNLLAPSPICGRRAGFQLPRRSWRRVAADAYTARVDSRPEAAAASAAADTSGRSSVTGARRGA
jgi:hypothetical protein